MDQHLSQERSTHLVEQLTQQLQILTTQLHEQRTRYEHEFSLREHLEQHVQALNGRLDEMQHTHQEMEQQLLGVLAQHQDQLAALHLHLGEQAQRYEFLSQLYLTLEQRLNGAGV
jgi:uncharacterized protein YPO0396